MNKIFILILTIASFTSHSQVTGTGFAIHSDGYIATNYHVIEGQDNFMIKGVNGDYFKSYPATVVKVDKNNDLAILKVNINFGTIPYGFKKEKLDIASNVYAYGYPLTDLLGNELKFTEGIINANSGLNNDPRWYQHTATIHSGNSGGPLFNKYGNLIGINNAGVNNEAVRKVYGTETTNINYAIKARYLLNLIEDIELNLSTNSGINKLDIPNQFKQIRKFVYLIEGSKSKKDNSSNNTTTTTTSVNFEKAKWYIDFDKAAAISMQTGKPIVANFTGSDWCGWCIRLKKEVFDTKEFKDWADKNVVLLELDYPRRTPQDEKIKMQNRELQQFFKVRGYPTLHMFNVGIADGKTQITALGKMGYLAGGPTPWITNANNYLKK